MDFQQFFTEYDNSISNESFRDPMGMQVIWSALGQEIFGWHITSRANDLRNYTRALYQHYVVREVETDDSIEIPGFARPFYGSKYDARFKTSLIIFLENLFVYTTVLKGLDRSGVLGSQSASYKLHLFENDPILLIHADAGILMRQISLGLNGSYKTPLMQLGVLDKDYQYPPEGIWAEIKLLFDQWEAAVALKEILVKIIKQVFDRCQAGGHSGLNPESLAPYRELAEESDSSAVGVRYSGINNKEELSRLYQVVLIDTAASRNHFGDFWKKQLGLDTGEAGAIFQRLVEGSDPYAANNQELLQAARQTAPSGVEKATIDDILAVEPLLAFAVSLFYLLCCRENQKLADIADYLYSIDGKETITAHWAKMDWGRVKMVAEKLGNDSTAGTRLKKLCENQGPWDLEACLQQIVAYHRAVMEERGLYPWVTVEESGKLRHTGRNFTRDAWKFTPWVHDYYLGSVKNIYHGLYGDEQ